jgi:hypothetical protein
MSPVSSIRLSKGVNAWRCLQIVHSTSPFPRAAHAGAGQYLSGAAPEKIRLNSFFN